MHYLVIGRGIATVDLERNAGVRYIPVLPSLVQCLGRGLLELGVLLPIALILCQGWLLCLECKIPPWFASLAAALLGSVGVPCLSAGGYLALMPFLSSLLLLLAVCAVLQWSMMFSLTVKMVELVGEMEELVELSYQYIVVFN